MCVYFYTVPLALPHYTAAATTLGEYTLPKDTTVMVNIYAIHHDPTHWKQPEEYKPERWLDEEGKLIKHDAYIPFGIGE